MGKLPLRVRCEHCGHEFTVGGERAPAAMLRALQLQAATRGIEVRCEKCQTVFLFRTQPEVRNPSELSD